MMKQQPKHRIIVVPGLNDTGAISSRGINFSLSQLKKYPEFEIEIYQMHWHDKEDFAPKLQRLVKHIEKRSLQGKVSLIGTSAGGAAVFNAFLESSKKVYKVVNVCGRLRRGIGKPTLDFAARTSPAFKQSVLQFEQAENTIPKKLLSRMMTIQPFFGDEIVPGDTVALKGAVNKQIYSFEHVISIGLALLFPQQIVEFLSR